MTDELKILVCIPALIVLIWLGYSMTARDVSNATEWCEARGLHVVKTEHPFFDGGPWWKQKQDRILKVSATDGNGGSATFWFCFGRLFSQPVYRQVGDQYQEEK